MLRQLHCESCNAKFQVGTRILATCPFCESALAPSVRDVAGGGPDWLLPFEKTRDRLHDEVVAWLSDDLAPEDILGHATFKEVTQVYVPFFLYSGTCAVHYDARVQWQEKVLTGYSQEGGGDSGIPARREPIYKEVTHEDAASGSFDVEYELGLCASSNFGPFSQIGDWFIEIAALETNRRIPRPGAVANVLAARDRLSVLDANTIPRVEPSFEAKALLSRMRQRKNDTLHPWLANEVESRARLEAERQERAKNRYVNELRLSLNIKHAVLEACYLPFWVAKYSYLGNDFNLAAFGGAGDDLVRGRRPASAERKQALLALSKKEAKSTLFSGYVIYMVAVLLFFVSALLYNALGFLGFLVSAVAVIYLLISASRQKDEVAKTLLDMALRRRAMVRPFKEGKQRLDGFFGTNGD